MDLVAQSPAEQRAQLFETAGARHEPRMDAAIIEKDFWVCWTLRRMFEVLQFRPHLIFKGGTFRLLPAADRLDALRRDYRDMETMIFGEAPDWNDIVLELQRLETRINSPGGLEKGQG